MIIVVPFGTVIVAPYSITGNIREINVGLSSCGISQRHAGTIDFPHENPREFRVKVKWWAILDLNQ